MINPKINNLKCFLTCFNFLTKLLFDKKYNINSLDLSGLKAIVWSTEINQKWAKSTFSRFANNWANRVQGCEQPYKIMIHGQPKTFGQLFTCIFIDHLHAMHNLAKLNLSGLKLDKNEAEMVKLTLLITLITN